MNLIKYLFILISFVTYSQYCPYLGPDQILPCGVGSTTLTADLSQCVAGTNPNQTTNYGVSNITYSPDSYTNGNSVFLGDDAISTAIPIGFNFCYFGQTYNTFYIGSNNWVGFSAGQTTTWVTTPIPNGTGSAPMNCIMGPWQDINPGIGGTIKWAVYGTAPCRRLVISYYQVPMFSCTSQLYSSQIKIYETTNVIETHILNKPICASWNSGNAVHGLHNANGTQSVLVQPPVSTSIRNNNQWSTQNEGIRFTPSGPVVNPVLTWYQVGNPNPIGTGPTITVNPPAQGANYTCHLVYPICNAGWSVCNASAGPGPDTVFVQPGPPNLPQPTVTFIDPTCYNYCDGSINVIPNGTNGTTTISWNTLQTTFNPNNLCAGNYSFLITDGIGCTVTGNATLTNPTQIIMNPISGPDTVCYLSSSESYDVPSMGVGYNYVWSTTPQISGGQGTDNITTDWSLEPSGLYQDSVSVYSISPNGCNSDTSYFTSFILNINPTIDPIGPFCDYDGCVDLVGTPLNGTFLVNGVQTDEFCPQQGVVTNNDVTYTYTQSNCSFDTTINVIVNPQPIITSIIPSYEFSQLCEGDSIFRVYAAYSSLSGLFDWVVEGDTIQDNNLPYVWNNVGFYTISVTQTVNGCVSNEEQANIAIQECPQELIYIPNTFTPDGDAFNNIWLPVFTDGFDVYNYNLLVFNRWGQIIFESHNHTVGWDGTYGNKMCLDGIYSWKIEYGSEYDDSRKMITGHLTIIR
jgi:gliding motility-associated-like protein